LRKEGLDMTEKVVGKTKRRRTATKQKEENAGKATEFSLHAPEAREVFLAGEFNSWDSQSLPMKKDKQGFWKTKIKLSPGRYEYKFLVDGVWVEDVPGEESVWNPHGTRNLIRVVS
jgi:1,4-alpha-glucan branching enzyme